MTPTERAHDILSYAAELHAKSKIGSETVRVVEAIAHAIRTGQPLSTQQKQP